MAVPPPLPDPLVPDPVKIGLRVELRARRAGHVASLGKAAARAAAEAAAGTMLPHIPPGAIVSLYLALQDELDPEPLIAALHARGHKIALPTLLDRITMRFLAWAPGEPLARGPMNLRQPLASAAARAPDLIITPLLGFDRTGGRIGYGAGHYDRAFLQYPGARRIGFAWAMQEIPHVPHDPWDVRIQAIATECQFLRI